MSKQLSGAVDQLGRAADAVIEAWDGYTGSRRSVRRLANAIDDLRLPAAVAELRRVTEDKR